MKRLTVLILTCALAPLAGAQLYKYVDKDGKTVYSDQPPANVDSKTLNIQSGGTKDTPAASGAKSYVQQDKDLQKGRDEAREKAAKADEVAKITKGKEDACNSAKSAYLQFSDGDRMHRYNDKGEKEFLGEEEIVAAKERAKRDMDEACKK
jgi:hypothetical protein